jgi:hypothetical protein
MMRFFSFLIITLSVMMGNPMSLAKESTKFQYQVVDVYYLGSDQLITGRGHSVYSLAVDSAGNLYAPDYRHNQVIVFDADFQKKQEWEILTPHGVSWAAEDFVYVSTYRSGRVHKFTADGKEVKDWDRELRELESWGEPVDVFADESGDVYVICDYARGKIIKAAHDGKFIFEFNTMPLRDQNEDFFPHSLIAHNNKMVYVASNKGIHLFDLKGRYLKSWSKIGKSFNPLAIRSFSGDKFLVPNYAESSIEVFSDDGQWLGALDAQEGYSGLRFPTNIAIDPNHLLYVVEEDGNQITKIKLIP